ncbi:sel1 repeat family protein [Rubellimicrobium rubrum]|uniref:Sel1 repeat family protein n=1 Tax=Rubellimicrobium rubrum TaxID=2585369 RepID=A0A5C4N303_9RHOB|nr:sel1 repeat family protein [Rubellimicrobium rubrum]TNC52318.1 sel1 repeat family protein [Rubellimicrobium rubrum]
MILRATALILLAAPALADEYGTTNPEEMTLNRMVENARRGEVDMTTCASGYLMTKSGQHAIARETFEACAEAGYTGAMTWMSYLEDNGFGGDYDPDASTEWNRRAAEAGDPIGMFNHGLDLLRGHGTALDEERGRDLIDRAAAEGVTDAQRLVGSGYDLDVVTPDADNWKYAPLF